MYSFDSRVRYSEIGEDKKLTFQGILNYFQDCCGFQAEDLGIGVDYLAENHVVWVLTGWQILVDRYPELGEEIRVFTWPYEFKGFFGMRNFSMETMEGERLAYANSFWTFLDTQDGRPTKVSDKMQEVYQCFPKLEMEYAPRKLPMPEGASPEEPFAVHKMQLDTNHHVNNGQYVQMAREYLPEGFQIRQMRAVYRQQATLGDMICPQVKTEDGLCTVGLMDEGGKPYAVVEFASPEKAPAAAAPKST